MKTIRYYILKLPFADPNWNREQTKINLQHFVPVWTGLNEEFRLNTSEPEELLEEIFSKFNVDHPEHYAASSLSVGDVVALNDPSEARVDYYMCCGLGWQKVELVEGT